MGPYFQPTNTKGIEERLDALKPPHWLKQPATWIAFVAILISVCSWLFPRSPVTDVQNHAPTLPVASLTNTQAHP